MKKLTQYSSLAAAFFAGGHASNGQIVYHNLDPDAMRDLGNTNFVSYEPLIYLDIDDDGLNDISFDVVFDLATTFYNQANAVVNALNDDWSILLSSINETPQALKYGNNIGSGGLWQTFSDISLNTDETNIVHASFYGENCETLSLPTDYSGNFYNKIGRFIGIRFNSGADKYYGWIRLSTDYHEMCPEPLNDALTLTIHDFAFNSTPNEPLYAGETGFDCNAPFPLMPVPLSPGVETIKWQAVAGAEKYKIRYRKTSTLPWTNVLVNAPKTSKKLTALSCNTEYEWKIAASCDGGTTFSAFSDTQVFTTDACKLSGEDVVNTEINIYPNPAHNFVYVHAGDLKNYAVAILNMQGQLIQDFKNIQTDFLKLDISQYPTGIYTVNISGGQTYKTLQLIRQ